MLSENDGRRLRRAGFTNREINIFAQAVDPTGTDQPPVDLSQPVWQTVMLRRHRIRRRLKRDYERTTGRRNWESRRTS